MSLANSRQAKENCPDLKPLDANTFGRVIDLISPNVTKPKRGCLLSAILVHLTEVFHLGPFLLSTTVILNG